MEYPRENLNPILPMTGAVVRQKEKRIRKLLAERNPYGLDIGGRWLDRIFAAYRQPHRYFHTLDHLLSICEQIRKTVWDRQELAAQLLLTALFHDVVWYPQGGDSEEDSVNVYLNMLAALGEPLPAEVKEGIRRAILSTKYQDDVSELAGLFHTYDCQVIIQGNHVDLLAYEFQIFREFQYLNMIDYRKGRSAFFQRFAKRYPQCRATMNFLIEYQERRRPRVGIYAGTFSPFHIGHLSILEKAEMMFDKVIIAIGINPQKQIERDERLDVTLPFHEVIYFDTLMVDLLEKESALSDVTLVRGLRNGYDLDYEMNQLCFMQQMRPNTHTVYIPCDKRLEHVSSSALKAMSHFPDLNGRDRFYYPNKYDYYHQPLRELFSF
ncbi:MAG: adenylyltransferase/cytidyltransferase family protein [Lentisphaerae bacterium]|nr:adenylyltransferase/cytidyltransferase family protein [Lentisphaerota bacterium]